jgi:AmmeMemoRadiSam system protein B
MSGGTLPRTKEPHLAGRWYPADAAVLARAARELLDAGGSSAPGVCAIVVPHAAYQFSGATAARGWAVAGRGRRRAVVLAPSHFAAFRGAAVLPMDGYRTPLGVVPIDRQAVEALAQAPLVRANPAVFLREHAVEIQLPLLQTAAPGCALVPVLVGDLEPGDGAALAAVMRPFLAEGAETLVVVSTDFVHYGRRFDYLPVPPTDAPTVAGAVRQLDEGALAHVEACDADGFVRYVADTGATICGRHPLEVLLRALPAGTQGERLAYTTSLEVSGDHEHTVSYAAVAFHAAAA